MRRLRKPNPRRRPAPPGPAGFTLVELLVVVGVMIVLTVMTLNMVNVTQDEDRVRAGAAQIRSFLEGARDRAIHAKEPRGVRFIMDQNLVDTGGNEIAISSMLYIGSPESYNEGQIRIVHDDLADPSSPVRTIEFPTDAQGNQPLRDQWINLVQRGLISQTGAVLRIFDSSSQPEFFTMNFNAGNFRLTKDYTTAGIPKDYSLQLNPTVLPNQEPRQFPRDVYIDFENSQTPATWDPNTGSLDLLFSPHGTVTGREASAGVISLVVAEGIDISQGRAPGAANKEGNERIVSIRTQTGGLGVHFVDPTDVDGTPGPDDPFRYAASGEAAQ